VSSFLVFAAIDYPRVKGALGSGDEKFCASILRSGGPEGRDLAPDRLKEWTRGVTALVLGELGQSMSERDALSGNDVAKCGEGLALAFTSLLEHLTQGPWGVETSLQHSGADFFWEKFMKKYLGRVLGKARNPQRHFLSRPLFGLESDHPDVLWGGLDRKELAAVVEKLPRPEEASDAEDSDIEQVYCDLYEVLGAVKQTGLDLVTFYG
jgi:hypothetical protein